MALSFQGNNHEKACTVIARIHWQDWWWFQPKLWLWTHACWNHETWWSTLYSIPYYHSQGWWFRAYHFSLLIISSYLKACSSETEWGNWNVVVIIIKIAVSFFFCFLGLKNEQETSSLYWVLKKQGVRRKTNCGLYTFTINSQLQDSTTGPPPCIKSHMALSWIASKLKTSNYTRQ